MGDKILPEITITELARRLAAQRQIVEGTCVVCGQSFHGTRKRRFCSHRCAQKHHWLRKMGRAVSLDQSEEEVAG
jgi:endogenous inhibitor of DNA gyrase (YacG/DUF329 family)